MIRARTVARDSSPHPQGWADVARPSAGGVLMTQPGPVVGIDVAKAELVVAVRPGDARWRVPNDARGLARASGCGSGTWRPPSSSLRPPGATNGRLSPPSRRPSCRSWWSTPGKSETSPGPPANSRRRTASTPTSSRCLRNASARPHGRCPMRSRPRSMPCSGGAGSWWACWAPSAIGSSTRWAPSGGASATTSAGSNASSTRSIRTSTTRSSGAPSGARRTTSCARCRASAPS